MKYNNYLSKNVIGLTIACDRCGSVVGRKLDTNILKRRGE
jgi:hypothetical protein